MRKSKIIISSIVGILTMAVLLNSCKEVGPVVPWGNNGTFTDTTYIESPAQQPQAKVALLEDITGIACSNCPAAHAILDGLITSTGGKVVGVSYHVGQSIFPLDGPPPAGAYQNLTSADAKAIVTNFVFPGYGPACASDRIIHQNAGPGGGETSIWDISANWSGYTNTEIAQTTPVNLYLSTAYTSIGTARQINIYVGIHYTAAQTDSDKLSIYLTEDSIISAQLLQGNSGDLDDSFYVHNHIMRAAVTNPLGNIISVPSVVKGRVDSLAFTYVIPAADSLWNPYHMNVVAFVHKYQNNRNDVLQTTTKQLFPH
jgi:hypothetical protein